MCKTGISFARARGAHRNIERECEDLGIDRLRAPYQIKADLVIVVPKPIKLEPEHIGRGLCRLLDGGAAGDAERVGNARALRGFRHQQIGARPNQRRSAHGRDADWRRVAAAKQFNVDRRQRWHHAVTRHNFNGIKCRPIVRDADIVPGTGVAIFEGKKRHVARRAPAQPGRGRKALVVFLKVRVLADRRHRRLFCRHIMHGEVLFFASAIIAALGAFVPPISEVTERGTLEGQRMAIGTGSARPHRL